MTSRTIRTASRLCAALLFMLLAHVALAQPPKDPPNDPLKGSSKDAPKATPEEQKAKEAFLAGKLDDALKALQAAAKTNPSIAPAKVIAARWCVETKQGQQARLLLEQAAAEEPSHPEVLLTNASFALGEGRVTDTILSCLAALQAAENPRWDVDRKKTFQREARLGLVAAYEARGDIEAIATHLTALLATDAKNAPLRQKLARANFMLNKPEIAFTDLQTAFADDPTLDPPELSMAQLWTAKEEFTKAEKAYGTAIEKHGGSAKVHRAFAEYLLNRGQGPLAKAHLTAAQKLEPNARETKALVGLAARYAKDYPTATQIFEELVRDFPAYPFATINLALVLAESSDAKGKGRAIELMENHVKQNQRSADAWSIYGYCLFKAGRAADAEKAAQSVLGLGQQLGLDGAYFLGKILADRGAADNAHKILKAACEKKDWFVYRTDAEALLAELDKKITPPKK